VADGETGKYDETGSRISHFFRKSVQWQPNCPMQTDRQTGMTTLIVAFRIFSNAPKTPFMKDDELHNQPQDYNLLHGTGFLSWFPCVFKANAEMVPKSKLPLHASHVSLPM